MWIEDNQIVVVSGLPRTGTSLMMQLLESGGIALLTDGHRTPNTHNPAGYFEYERVKQLPVDHGWMGEAQGCAIKVVAPLLQFLPVQWTYKVIFMERDLEEVVASQAKMLKNSTSQPMDSATLLSMLADQICVARQSLERLRADVLTVNYRQLVSKPEVVVSQLRSFLKLGAVFDPDVYRVDTALYRNRRSDTQPLNSLIDV